jgi:FMN phosphatase YigB (HAD superfamily)
LVVHYRADRTAYQNYLLVPVIFNAALAAQGVTAEESIYVDDYDAEADGAREQGFTSFLIDRSGKNKNEWSITSLKQIIDFVERQE